MKKTKFSLIIPMYYEEKIIKICYNKILDIFKSMLNYDYEIIFINDKKNRENVEYIKNLAIEDRKVKVITFAKNEGQQYAVVAGMKYAQADYLIILDSKLEDAIETIPQVINEIICKKSNKDIQVIDVTVEEEIKVKLFDKKQFIKMSKSLLEKELPKETGDYRIVSNELMEYIFKSANYNVLTRGLFSWENYNESPFEKKIKERPLGVKKIYKVLGIIGYLLLFATILIVGYMVASKVMHFESVLPYWIVLVLGIMVFYGVQLVIIDIISKHLAKNFDEYYLKKMIYKKINIK